jgi:hypothetical protein
MKTVKQLFAEIALVSGLVDDSCVQIEGPQESFRNLLRFLQEHKQSARAAVFECSLCKELDKVFLRKYCKSKTVRVFPRLNIMVGLKNNVIWNIAVNDAAVNLTMNEEMFLEFVSGIELKAQRHSDFYIGPDMNVSQLPTGQSKRDWRRQNKIFVF